MKFTYIMYACAIMFGLLPLIALVAPNLGTAVFQSALVVAVVTAAIYTIRDIR